MQFEQIMTALKKLVDKRAIAAREKTGIKTDNYLGVSLIKLKNLSKKIKKDHQLAIQLRNSGIYDAILLSFMVDEPKKVSKHEAKNIIKKIDHWILADNFCLYILLNASYVFELVDEWIDSSKEMTKRSAYFLVRQLAGNNKKLDDNYFEEFLERIEREISYSKNWVKEAMLNSIIIIGSRNENLREKAMATAEKIGKIKINYGSKLYSSPEPLKLLQNKNFVTKGT